MRVLTLVYRHFSEFQSDSAIGKDFVQKNNCFGVFLMARTCTWISFLIINAFTGQGNALYNIYELDCSNSAISKSLWDTNLLVQNVNIFCVKEMVFIEQGGKDI